MNTRMETVTYVVAPGGVLRGTVLVPGDKSVSHRAVMLAALAEGSSEIDGFLEGADSLATLAAFRALGIGIEGPARGRVVVHGRGLHGLRAAPGPLDLGNSGTSMRLMTGILAGQAFPSVLLGDASLSTRPMRRITEPLAQMGAVIGTSTSGSAPLEINGGSRLVGITYPLPVASAQVKSCLLLAGLYADGETVIIEPAPTRDHTERMLAALGYPVRVAGNRIALSGGGQLVAAPLSVPADLSSAAFFAIGACIAPGSEVRLEGVGTNPTRRGVLDILEMMGADIVLENPRERGAEPVADLVVRHRPLHGIDIPAELVPLAIDEFPALFVAAACAKGTTRLTGAAELRVKESDRIGVMADGLRRLGGDATATDDGIVIHGGRLHGGAVDSHGDHRVAMAFAMAALAADGAVEIADCGNVDTSFPGFPRRAAEAGLRIEVHRG